MNTSSIRITKKSYENNPFFVALGGVELLFAKARPIAIALAVFAGFLALSSLPSAFVTPDSSDTAATPATDAEARAFADTMAQVPSEVWLLGGLLLLSILTFFIALSLIIRGVLDYTTAQLANGRTATLSEAFRAVFTDFWGYAWVMVIAGVKIFLWTLLFIIPGIIMSVRYSLAGVAYFDKKLRGNASVVHSSRLTKGAWLTTFASQNLLNILTFGFLQPVLTPGTNAVLYRQLGRAGTVKPKAHLASWLTLLLPLVFILIITLIVAMLVQTFAGYVPTT